ncbi:MAG TPA: FAD-dependent oxidoreductase [Solirubrobacterales bacterium]|nr:FAD-dependent oxidoreductase [Solirubrobacterales bacterium]
MDERYRSYWIESAVAPEYPPPATDLECDVAVIGAGIVGVSAALELTLAGAEVALLEARRVGSGATGYTTGKLSSLAGLIYADLEQSFGAGTARDYAEASEAGLAAIADNVERYGLECDFRRKPNFTYTESEQGRPRIEQEAEAAARAGLPATLAETRLTELPFSLAAAVRCEDQAELHALRYLNGLTAAAAEAGCRVHEGSRAVGAKQGDPCVVETESGVTVRARRVILATHLPILDRGLFFARTHPERSYALLARLRGQPPQGMYLSDESPAHSLRSVATAAGERLLVGGESHKAGQGDEAERFAALERWARERFDVEEVEYRWATQDHLPHDQLPFVGPVWPFGEGLLTATGMRKWGLAFGTAAASILAGSALGREHRWARSFDSTRLDPRRGAASLLKENADDGLRFLSGRLAGRHRSAEDLAAGEGAVVASGLAQTAAYRDDDGALHLLSARCTHLGCIVKFNAAERTWDCPCHGSRFDPVDGSVLEGPAVRPLAGSGG